MKSESNIRRYRDLFRQVRKLERCPCLLCLALDERCRAMEQLLSWCLSESPEMDAKEEADFKMLAELPH